MALSNYGTQNINWGTDPADNDLGVHSVKVTGMMNKSSIGTAQVRLWSNSGLNALLDNGGAVPAAERGSDPVNPIIVVSPSTNTNPADDPLVPIAVNMRLGISAKTSLGRVYTQLSGPRGDSGNLTSSTYTVHATVLNGPANSAAHVPGWSFQPSFPGVSIGFVDYSPGTSVVIPAYRLPSPSVNGLTLTLNGAIPLGSGGVPGTDTLKLYEDITIGTSNLEIHSVVVTSITVSGGWAGLMAPYSQVVTLTRTTSNKILGNVNNTWRASAKIFQRIFGLGFSSDSTQVD